MIHTDGSCPRNPGPELMAGGRALKESCRVTLFGVERAG